MASACEDTDGSLHELRMVLLGASGVGKSATGNAILGREAFKETRTRVSEVQRGRVEDRNISVIDTPGFFNTELTDEDLQNEMMKSLSLSHPGPHVFLLIINMEKFKEDERNLVKQIQEIFGEESLQFTMILFIGREKMSRRNWIQFTESKNTQELLNCSEGRYHVMNSKNECDTNQIKKLFKNIDEMMRNNGEHYTIEIHLKNQNKLREQNERMKQEELRKRHMEILKTHLQRDRQDEEKRINQEKKTESDDVRKQEDVSRERRDVETVQETKLKHLSEINVAVQEDFRTQTECQREQERQRCALQSGMTQDSDLRIVLLGKTKAGKSSTGNTILGRDAMRMFLTRTCEKQVAVVAGKTLSIIDTPELWDSSGYRHFKEDFKRDIGACLEMSAPGPHVFLLVIGLNGRSTEKKKNTVKWIQENFGEQAVQHILIIFTHTDLLRDEPLDEYIKKNNNLESLIKSCGGRYHSLNNQDRDNRDQVTQLLEMIEKLVKDNRGEHYNNEMCLQAQQKLSEQRERKKLEDMRHEETRRRQEPKETQEQEIVMDKGQSKDEEMTGDEKSGPEDIKRVVHELLTETDNLVRLTSMMSMHMVLRSLEGRITKINLPRQDLRIVMLGRIGSGKSSTGNTILGRDAFRASAFLTTRTCEKQETVVNGKTITIIDTPPVFMQFQDYLEPTIEKCVKMSAPGPHVFLLVIRLDVRFTEEEENTVKWIQKNFDTDVLSHTIVLFTHADWLNFLIDESLTEYIQKNNDLQSLIESCGGRYHTFNNRTMRNRIQVIELLMKIDKMVQRNGGKHYTKDYISKTLNKKKADSCQIQ